MSWRSALAGTCAATGLVALGAASPLAAQEAGADIAPGRLVRGPAMLATESLLLHHSTPKAGSVLTLVVEGAAPGGLVTVVFEDAAQAPPSLLTRLVERPEHEPVPDVETGTLKTFWTADDRGLVVISAALVRPDDAGAAVIATAFMGGVASPTLSLRIQPPLLLVPSVSGVERIDLRDGHRLLPPIAGTDELLGAALSRDGSTGYMLRGDGRLSVHDAHRWDVADEVRRLPIASDTLASSRDGGLAFALARPSAEPFTPPASAVFLDVSADAGSDGVALLLGPMGREVGGRRWAVTADGLAAFVAEDAQLVREIDLLDRATRRLYPVGSIADNGVEDMLVAGGRLYVVTSRGGERVGGTLTVLELDTGAMSMASLDVTPSRLLDLRDGRVLLVPRDASVAHLVEDGLLMGRVLAPVSPGGGPGEWVDAAVTSRGALMLHRDQMGLFHLDLLDGGDVARPFAAAVPAATRLVGAGFDAVIMLGSDDERVRRVDVITGAIEVLDGIVTRPDVPFFVLD